MKSLWEARDYGIGRRSGVLTLRFSWVIQADAVVLNPDFSDYIGLGANTKVTPFILRTGYLKASHFVDLTGDLRHIM